MKIDKEYRKMQMELVHLLINRGFTWADKRDIFNAMYETRIDYKNRRKELVHLGCSQPSGKKDN